jgi:signal transduction histidine kinase
MVSKTNLTSKIIYRMIKDLMIGVAIFCILNWGCRIAIQEHFLTSGYLYEAERDTIEQFQKYVDENELKVTDTQEIRTWVEEKNIEEFVVSKGKYVYFDNTYGGGIFPGAVQKNVSKFLYPIDFEDGQAELYIYDGCADKYYNIIAGVSAIIGIVICFIILGNELQEDIKAILCIQTEVERIGEGNLEDKVSIERRDEIGQLASGINSMRKQLMEHKKKEEKMKQAQAELVLGMAHDLRTPLTGLFSYLEIIQKLEKEGKTALEYVTKSLDKAEQLRSVSDQLFEYFLASNETDIEMEEPEIVQSAFEDYLSEFCAFLQCNSFSVETEEISWQPVKVQLNTDFFGRIMNNLISNIEKYADKQAPVYIKIIYTDAHIELNFQNRIITPNPYVKGTGIGLKNIDLMMKQMEGSSEVAMTEDTYSIRLIFPISK